MLKALPLTPEPNAGVESGISHPSKSNIPRPFKHIQGFTGIVTGDNVTVNRFDIEPPDQGLAVHNDVVAEINNLLVQFFKSDGTPLTNPIATSAFFLTEATIFPLPPVDLQAFFDPKSKRWFFNGVIDQFPFEGFALAVSKTSDPLGEYFIYHVRAFSDDVSRCAGVDCLPDFQKAGYDANALFITADLIDPPPALEPRPLRMCCPNRNSRRGPTSLILGSIAAASHQRTLTLKCSPAFRLEVSPLKLPLAVPSI